MRKSQRILPALSKRLRTVLSADIRKSRAVLPFVLLALNSVDFTNNGLKFNIDYAILKMTNANLQGEPMEIELRELRKQDEKKAIRFAIKGMHFDWYMDSKFALNLYGRYFWYLETSRATQIIAAYADNQFVGVILAEIKGKPKRSNSKLRKVYVTFLSGFKIHVSKIV